MAGLRTIIKEEDASLSVYDDYLEKEYGNWVFEEIGKIPLTKQPKFMMFGKECQMNRDVGFFSDVSKGYSYSGQIEKSQKLYDWMKGLLEAVNESLGTDFNGILINVYHSSDQYISAHSDDEKGLSKINKTVAAISFGTSRKFRIRNKKTKAIVVDIMTKDRQLLLMDGEFQKKYTHEIVKQKGIEGKRISFTFRTHDE